ncbi:MAG: hypothetical protein IT493_11425 [Gammaproteobacteria bacterium]|nr:hypothetical protein [Gammaproteobacteria bacterium]
MPLRNPNDYRDKTADWLAFFANRRRQALAPLVTPALVREHEEDPRGGDTPHGFALQDVLNYVHNMPTDGKSFAYAEVPYRRYRLGIMHARGHTPTFPDDRVFTSEREAVHAVFLERLCTLHLTTDAEDQG